MKIIHRTIALTVIAAPFAWATIAVAFPPWGPRPYIPGPPVPLAPPVPIYYPPPVVYYPPDWVAAYNQAVLERESPQTWALIQNNHRLQQPSAAPAAPSGEAPKIQFSTDNPGDWAVTGAGAVKAPALGHADHWPRYNWSGNVISLSSGGDSRGEFVNGASLAKFDGYWTATYTFTIPKGATGVTLSFSDLFADDRAVVELNGVQIASTGLGAPGDGSMVMAPGGAAMTYTFKGEPSGTITTGFVVGGQNTLTAIINNTDYGLDGQLATVDPANGTDFSIKGAVFYNTGSPAATTSVASSSSSSSSASSDNGPAPLPLKVDDIKALTAAGVKPDAIIQAIKESKPTTYSSADIQSAQQASPPVDPSVIAFMQNPTS